MDRLDLIEQLSVTTESKILFLVMDGLGDIDFESKPTPLTVAQTPNLDALAKDSICGLMDSISPGITPGSGPAHLGLFGYDPVNCKIGRGILAAAGIGFPLEKTDVAARGNFATMDKNGIVTDRRAGRISTEENIKLCSLLQDIQIEDEDVKIFVQPVKEHRCSIVFRGENLVGNLTDSDPQKTGLPIKEIQPSEKVLQSRIASFEEPLEMQQDYAVENLSPNALRTAKIANEFQKIAIERLKDQYPANLMLLRGFAKYPDIKSMQKRYKLNPSAIAVYPDYKGIARLIGMKILEVGETICDEFKTVDKNFAAFDFFFVHIKKTDSYGEDGNFDKKVSVIEEVDKNIPLLLNMKFDAIVITGDHSTPWGLKSHSWHPLPVLLWSKFCRKDNVVRFSESDCIYGGLGRIQSIDLMPLVMANSLKLLRFGA